MADIYGNISTIRYTRKCGGKPVFWFTDEADFKSEDPNNEQIGGGGTRLMGRVDAAVLQAVQKLKGLVIRRQIEKWTRSRKVDILETIQNIIANEDFQALVRE